MIELPPLPEIEVQRCKVCHAPVNDEGFIDHGKGCYQYDENGGGSEYIGERHSPEVVREYARSYAQAAVLAERELWDLLDKHGITLARAYIRDNSGRWNGWWGCGPKGEHIGRGETMYEAALACAAAIREVRLVGAIRSQEGLYCTSGKSR